MRFSMGAESSESYPWQVRNKQIVFIAINPIWNVKLLYLKLLID